MPYVAVYRALVKPPPQRTILVRAADHTVFLDPGPLTFHHQSAILDPTCPSEAGTAFDLDHESTHFKRGSYAVIVAAPALSLEPPGASWSAALDVFGRAVVALDLAFPGMLDDRIFEAAVATRATPPFISPHEGLQLGERRSYAHEEVAAAVEPLWEHVGTMPAADVERFTLASRWFRRANDAKNSIDRLLFYYMVLEVYPSVEGRDVPGDVARLLAERVYPALPASEVKSRLTLGRICGFRGEIIHDGKASVASMDEWRVVNEHVERLRAVARTCLRVLAGLPPGSELDRYVLQTAGSP